MKPTYFASAAEFRRWLRKNHAAVKELQVGFFKKATGRPGLTYKEAVDEALCFGWIDGVVRRVDATRFTHRFTPRRPGSIWSNVNVRHVARLTAAGRMQPAGLAAFAARSKRKTGVYAFEQQHGQQLPPAFEREFRQHAAAWEFFNRQAPWYRRLAIHKIVSPKQPATRERWLQRVIAASAAGRRF
jgi:uncharacterized protein YdeI (YjbR/CyaY-like superfamily)